MNQLENERQMLLNSMQKLIKYIQISKANQWEIFESLSKKDITKILNNLNDQDPKIRKLSLTLLGSILDDNQSLRARLCQRMEIPLFSGKICLNFNSLGMIHLSKEKIARLVNLLKQNVKKQDQIFPIWILNVKSEVLKVDFIPLSTLNYIDPSGHLMGFTLLQENNENPKKAFLSLVGSLTPSQKNEIRDKKPLFKVSPMTDRNSSYSSELSNRFTRTVQNNKTSLKHHTRRSSLLVQGTQNDDHPPKSDIQKEIKIRQRFQSERTSPQMIRKTQQNYSTDITTLDGYWNRSKNSYDEGQFTSVTPSSIVKNTNIYITGPVSEISLHDTKIGIKKLIEQKGLKSQINNYEPNINKSPQQYNIRDCLPQSHSGENECNIFIQPFKKYERKTIKQDSIKEVHQFDYNKYRQFLKNVNDSDIQRQGFERERNYDLKFRKYK